MDHAFFANIDALITMSPFNRPRMRGIILLLCMVQYGHTFLSPHHRRPTSTISSAFTQLFSSRSQASTGSFYVATCIPGLSGILAQELTDLGCRQVEVTGQSAARFTADSKTALTTILYSRTAHKIMECLCQGDGLQDRSDLAAFIQDHVNVKDLLGDGQGGLLTVSVSVLLNNPTHIPKDINHSHYSALCIKNALCDVVRDLRGDRPDVDLEDTDVPLVAALVGDQVTGTASISLYRQLHVGSLHRRGYRQGNAIHKAAMKESLAAGLLLSAGFDKRCRAGDNVVLLDPMAGSGTLLLEAVMIAAELAPGLMRIKCGLPGQSMPCIVRWKCETGDISDTWKALLVEATSRARTGLQRIKNSDKLKFVGNEIHPGALELFERALEMSGMDSIVQTSRGNCRNWSPVTMDPSFSSASWFVVTNPPWGERLTDDMHESWEDLRVFLRETCLPRTEAWILSGNADATKHLGLSRSASIPLKTGTQTLRWLQYVIRDPNNVEQKLVDTPRIQRTGRPSITKTSSTTTTGNYKQAAPRSSRERSSGGGIPKRMSESKPRRVASPRTSVDNDWLV